MTSFIDASRIVPVSEDLTQAELGLSIIRGNEKMFRIDKKLAPSVSLVAGEFGVLQNDGTVARPTATPVAETYLVQAGSDRFDSHATGQVTLIMNSNIIIKTNQFYAGGSYVAGTMLTVKNLGAGQACVSPAGVDEFVVGKVIEAGQGYLVAEIFPVVVKKQP